MKLQQSNRRTIWLAAIPLLATFGSVATAQNNTRPAKSINATGHVLKGEVSFRERIALLPGATLHILVVKDIPGESGIPIGSTTVPARNGSTRFSVNIPHSSISASGPYRVRSWIIAGGKVFMRSLATNTTVERLSDPLHIMVGRVGSNGQTGTGGIVAPAVQKVITGKVAKLDRRGIAQDALVTVELRELSSSGAVLQVLSTQEIPMEGKQLPAEYRIEVPASLLHPGKTFDITAKLTEGGNVTYKANKSYPLDTGVIQQNVDLLVNPSRTGWIEGRGPIF